MSKRLPEVSDLQSLLNRADKLNDCLIYRYGKTPNGYSKLRWNGKTISGHRLSLYFSTGKFAECALHLCDNPACINPDHLKWGTFADNSADMVDKNRQAKGSKIHQSKLTEKQVASIKAEYSVGDTSWRLLALKYGVSKTVIGYILKNKFWTHIN